MAIPVVTSLNPLSENITFQKTPISNKFYSSKLLNFVDFVEIDGSKKTVFYSELNTNFNVGDRIFIVNGNYDSGEFIRNDKYTKYTDGYRVLGCDGCRIILDLDYTGVLPYAQNEIDKTIKVYHIRTQKDFDYINTITVNQNGISFTNDLNVLRTYFNSPSRISKFCGRKEALGSNPSDFTAVLCSDSIIFIDSIFVGSTSIYNKNAGAGPSGFFVRDDTVTSNPPWINITNEVLSGKIKIVNPSYSEVEKNIYINGEDIIINNYEFKQRNTYSLDGNIWNLNLKYKIPYISRLNFRYGKFKGKHQDGIFGTNIKKNNWNGTTWNSGAFINSLWNTGVMNSKSTPGEKTFYSTFDSKKAIPVQTIDFSNNKSFGYNLIEDSIILKGEIKNGNIENCNIGSYVTYSALDIYFGLTYSFGLTLGGSYKRCDINNVISQNARFTNSFIYNSNLNNSDIVNSQVYYSSAKNSTFTDEEGIKVIAADLWSYNYDISSESSIRGILKLYISDEDSRKLSIGESFYITKVNKNLFLTSLSNDEKIKLPIETKFFFGIYTDLELESGKVIVTVKNKNDNKFKTNVEKITNYINITVPNNFNYASIDIESRFFGWYVETQGLIVSTGTSITPPRQIIRVVNEYGLNIRPQSVNSLFSGIFISNSDFHNGFFDKSNWKSGAYINYANLLILNDNFGNLDIETIASNKIRINISRNNTLDSNRKIFGEDLAVGDIVWLNSIDHVLGSNSKSIDGRYRVLNIVDSTFREVYLQSLSGVTFSPSADYRVNGALSSNYSSIHKFRINNSTINSGLLCRTSIVNSVIVNLDFNNRDKELDIRNVERLRLINILFKDTQNSIRSGYIFKSHIVNDTWKNGIAFNSIFNGATFEDGVFNTSYWQNGNFKQGSFINSKDILASTQSYDNSTSLYKNWNNGVFDNGEFYNSTWMKGTFNNGRFYNSEWYSGRWNNGILGSDSIRAIDTKFGFSSPILPLTSTNSVWRDGVVENAIVGGSGSVYWYGGRFNKGEFTSNGQVSTNESIWFDGNFNNGRFSGLARWKNGNFYKGKFHSYYGISSASALNPSTYSYNYSWENGKFLGGEFGNADLATNSVWYDGEFAGGIFQGRFWYKGLFTKGEFFGSATSSIFNSNISNIGEYEFANSFLTKYYGLWFSGNVSDNPKDIKTNERVFTQIVRKTEEVRLENEVKFNNMLWINGTFSHKSATMQNSLWLNGNFYYGTFDSSIFNPYIDRSFTSNINNSSFASTQSCTWYNGTFDSTLGTGSFYISNWSRGLFKNGYMSGAVWKNGVWNYGFADNIVWLDGLWRNGNWNGAPFGINDLDLTAPNRVRDGRAKSILLNVMNTLGIETLYLNNVFSASTTQTILTDPTITSINTINSSVTYNPEFYALEVFGRDPITGSPISSVDFRSCSNWVFGTTVSSITGQVIANDHVYTSGGQSAGSGLTAESAKLYACRPNLDKDVFYQANKNYIITLQVSVEGVEKIDLYFKVGNKDEVKTTLQSQPVLVNGTIVYRPKQYNFRFIYSTTTVNTPTDTQFYLKKGKGGIMRVLFINITQTDYNYHPEYNNSLLQNTILGSWILVPTSTEISYDAVSSDGNVVSVSFGNGLFKSGIWENGIWNNGYRSNQLVQEKDYYLFSNIVGLNGVFPYSGKGTYQISSVSWLVTLQSIETLDGLSIGDNISIGNLVAIDINESRRLIKDYYKIQEIDLTANTIVVELITNFPILRVEKDSANHLIYVTKNIWLTGAFLNGYFKGVWNNGLFKSYPRIGIMTDSEWIDGKFDGGRFISNIDTSALVSRYNTGLVQNFEFIDNNLSATNQESKFASWIDVNYSTTQKTTINQESATYREVGYPGGLPSFTYSYFLENKVETSDPPGLFNSNYLSGYITEDILESTSTFRDVRNVKNKYKLGTKYKIFQNLIPNDGNFIQPFSNNRFGLTLDNFTNDGWNILDFGNSVNFASTFSPPTGPVTSRRETTKGLPIIFESNVDSETQNRLRIKTTNTIFSESSLNFQSTSNEIKATKFASIKLNNDNIETIRNRYYISNLDIQSISMTAGVWRDGSNQIVTPSPNISLTSSVSLTITGTDILEFTNEFNTPLPIKRQYFYNKQNLDLYLEVSTTIRELGVYIPPINLSGFLAAYIPPANFIDILFNNISFWEVDMIPFFRYYKNSNNIDTRIKTPWYAVAPFIDYTDNEFDFIGNINLSIDSETIGNQANYSVVAAGSVDGSVQPPIQAGQVIL